MGLAQFTTLAAVGITSLLIGFQYGRSSVLPNAPTLSAWDSPDSSAEEGESDVDGDLSAVKPGTLEPCKMVVLCVRTDLKMTPGKVAAQCGHATLACYKALLKSNPGLIRHWETTGQAKVALKCSSEEELLLLKAKAQSLNLCARIVEDAGRTEVDPGTLTVLGIGPAPVVLVNQVTGELKLL